MEKNCASVQILSLDEYENGITGHWSLLVKKDGPLNQSLLPCVSLAGNPRLALSAGFNFDGTYRHPDRLL